MQPELLETLRARLREADLASFEAQFLPHARLAFDLVLEGESQFEPGESRWGGAPDVPAGFEWPHAGKFPMAFLAQINLSDLIEDAENPFPPSGLLLFFADMTDDAPHIVFFDALENLRTASVPEGETEFGDIPARRLKFAPRADLPLWATSEHEELTQNMSGDQQDAYNDLSLSATYASTPERQRLAGQLLGHAAGIGHDPREDAFVVREHNPDWLYDYGRRGQLDLSSANRWQNLLRFDSVLDVCLGDAGYFNFLIHEDDLRRLDFGRVYASLESS